MRIGTDQIPEEFGLEWKLSDVDYRGFGRTSGGFVVTLSIDSEPTFFASEQ